MEKQKVAKTVSYNREASYAYYLEDKFECGIVLTGTEIKSIREGRVNLKESYVSIYHGEAWLKQMHISPYKQGNQFNVDEYRDRKLLLHKSEIEKLNQKVRLKGYTLVPVRLYLNDKNMCKVEIALAKGKNLVDKRETEKTRDAERQMRKALKLNG